jgi:hypothetical protein
MGKGFLSGVSGQVMVEEGELMKDTWSSSHANICRDFVRRDREMGIVIRWLYLNAYIK